MPYQDSSYQDSSYQDSSYPGGGGGSPTNSSSALPPMGPPLLWDAVMQDLQIFFDDLSGPVIEHGNDQNSYYDDGEGSAPAGALFLETFSFLTTVQNNPDAHYFDYLTNDFDPEFLLSMAGTIGFNATFGEGSLRAALMSDHSTVGISLNGLTFYGTYHSGAPVHYEDKDIVVTAGYWSFTFSDGGLTPLSNLGPSPPPPIPPHAWDPSATLAAATADPGGLATQEILSLRARLHQILDQNGGHLLVSYNTPDGVKQFALEEYVAVLDQYHVNVTTGIDYKNTTGGAGSFHADQQNGGWVTDFNSHDLVMYEIQAFHGLTFIILHEAGHGIESSVNFAHQMFDSWHGPGSYIGTDGHGQSSNFWNNEIYANNVAVAIEQLLHVEPPPQVPGGLNYIGPP